MVIELTLKFNNITQQDVDLVDKHRPVLDKIESTTRMHIITPHESQKSQFKPYLEIYSLTESYPNTPVDMEFARRYITILKAVYCLVKKGAKGSTENEAEPESALYDVQLGRHESSRFWTATLLTPEEVQTYGGREKVLKAPCSFIEEFEDGAVFLLVGNFAGSNFMERENLRDHFEEPRPWTTGGQK